MSEMVERVARASYEECMASYARDHHLTSDLEALVNEPDWEALAPAIKGHWRLIARAAIGAMRNMPQAIIDQCVAGIDDEGYGISSGDARRVWRGVIRAALERV